ncbi:MAG: hypothetical protein OXU23_13390 [Candidatus Poribacteria bacterium]|nr:hypothetical protein [Candidatus Poribacteria bacterium]
MLNDVIIHPTETHINVIHSNKTLTILVPKYIGISAEYFFFDNRERVLEFGMPFDPFKPMLKHPVKHIIITIIPAPPIEITAKDIVERFRKHKQKEQGN